MAFFLSFFNWLNLLSLDVVLISLAWQEIFAHAAGMGLKWEERAVLALSIWGVYIADHFLDGMVDNHSTSIFLSNKAPRHRYVKAHRKILGIFFLLACCINIWLLTRLSPSLLLAGSGLALVTASYLGANYFLLRRGCWFKGREIMIALIYSMGCALVPLVQGLRAWWLLPWVVAFAVIAWMNCTLIARMERGVNLVALAPRWLFFPRSILLLALIVMPISFLMPTIVKALCWSLLGLTIIPMMARRFGYVAASLAADQVLFFTALFALMV